LTGYCERISDFLEGSLLKDGVLTLELGDVKNKTVGGACGVGILRF